MKMYLDIDNITKNVEQDYNINKSVQKKLALIFGYRGCGKTKTIIDYLNSVSDNEILSR